MKYQSLAVIFIIIILPISMILTSYVQNQVKTIQLQTSYDTKLTNATYDALKAFQLNAINSSTSDLANSKLRDIEASVNTFFNSMATQYNMAGYSKEILQEYVPALVYTMYDGFYIFSPFTNTLEKEDEGETYKDGEKIYGLKPYIFYSARYTKSDTDVVITYSLDNYITVQGIVHGKPVNKSGYLLDNIQGSGDNITYRGVPIKASEILTEDVKFTNKDGTIGEIDDCPYLKINGVKYYHNTSTGGEWFSVLNGEKISYGNNFPEENSAGLNYYKDAQEFTKWVKDNLGNLNNLEAKDTATNEPIGNKEVYSASNYEIFSSDNNVSIEDPNSNFNEHRREVIRYSIEKNLSIAIANFNNYVGGTSANFQMPNLSETEWDKILNNISIISFMQGMSIGGKLYNGYTIVTNTDNEEVISTDSIYIRTNDGQYHKATDTDIDISKITGANLSVDFERKTVTNSQETYYYYPHEEVGCYSSIVSQTKVEVPKNIYEYMAQQDKNLASVYFTALGRERYSMYKTNNNPDEEFEKFQ